MLENLDFVLAECRLPFLQGLVEAIEPHHSIQVLKQPEPCLTLLRAEDSLDQQEFILGEALTTACEVSVDGVTGYGICLGEEPVRSYCIAVMDALREQNAIDAATEAALAEELQRIEAADQAEYAQILRTQVDFKLLEQE
jgi:phosphonate C-P lyase system protein PhnG